MHIAIDAKELEGKPTGVGRYLLNILKYWEKHEPTVEVSLIHHEPVAEEILRLKNVRLESLPAGLINNGLFRQQIVLPKVLKRIKPDVFFAPAYTMPVLYRGASVAAVHDISFKAHPEWYDKFFGFRLRLLAGWTLKRATKVMTISDFSKGEIVRHYKIDPEKITRIYLSASPDLLEREYTKEKVLKEKLMISGDFAVMVGSVFERRFPEEVIKSFRLIKDLNLQLVIAGDDRRLRKGDLQKEIDSMGLSRRVIWARYCKDEDLIGLYRASKMVIYLSAYEGFGLPPLEAITFNKPVIVSARGALLEVYSEVAALVMQETPEEIAKVIREVHSNEEFRNNLMINYAKYLEKYSLAHCANETLTLLREAVAEHGKHQD